MNQTQICTTDELLLNKKLITFGPGTKTGTATILYKGKKFQHLLINKEFVFVSDYENDKKFKGTVNADKDIIKYYTYICEEFKKAVLKKQINTIEGIETEEKFNKIFDFDNVIKPAGKSKTTQNPFPESFKISFGAYVDKNLTDGKDGKSTIPPGKSVGDLRCKVKDGAGKNADGKSKENIIDVNINNIINEIPRGTKFNATINEGFSIVSKKLHLTKYINSISVNRPEESDDAVPAATDEAVGRSRTKSEAPSFDIDEDEVENGKEAVEETFEEESEAEAEAEEEEEESSEEEAPKPKAKGKAAPKNTKKSKK